MSSDTLLRLEDPADNSRAIKTYNGEGVGQHGVIKSHHSQCYSGREVPRTRSREHPRRLGSGEFETGMQPRAIRVTSFDRTRKLDDMSESIKDISGSPSLHDD